MSFPASSNSNAGRCFAMHDVCKTPVPAEPIASADKNDPQTQQSATEALIPYPNTAMLQQASMPTLSQKVFIVGKHAATTNTEVSMSTGDEEGEGGGVVSGTVAGPCRFKVGSRKVFIEGHGAAYLGAMTAHNNTANSNMPVGMQVAASQVKVWVGPG